MKEKSKIQPVILAGGSGTRLWPLSRSLYPKQFISLADKPTMFQATLMRLEGLETPIPIVISNESHRFIVVDQLRESGFKGTILLEPFSRNTAPAIALAAFNVLQGHDDPVLLVLAADHVIQDAHVFRTMVERSLPLAEAGQLITFGIVPTEPHTGYGYIHLGEELEGTGAFSVKSFVEKPDYQTAQNYIDKGGYYWNSGMFMFRASVYLNELKKFRPDIYDSCERSCSNMVSDLDFIRFDKLAFHTCPDESVDYAVIEKTTNAVVVPLDAGWSDVGSWSALWEIANKDEHGNVLRGDVLTENTHNSYLYSEDKLIAAVGINDIVVVDTPDAVMVAHKDQVQEVKKITQRLNEERRTEATVHRKVYRPWGNYDSIDKGDRFQAKRIVVTPGAKLSVQMHHHRAEHWIVVSGTAKVTIDGVTQLLTENQSVYIPLGAVHALENPGKIELELIEVQTGSYLGEDDIIRFEDRYGRA